MSSPAPADESQAAQTFDLNELKAEVEGVRTAWRPFAAHAKICAAGCFEVAKYCHRPGRQSAQLDPKWDECCDYGKELYAVWRLAVLVLRDRYRTTA